MASGLVEQDQDGQSAAKPKRQTGKSIETSGLVERADVGGVKGEACEKTQQATAQDFGERQ